MKIAGDEPDVMLVSEVIPKAQIAPLSAALLDMPGYSMYPSFDPQQPRLGPSGLRGVCIFIKNNLQVSELSFGLYAHVENVWLQLSLKGNDRLLIGCLYRSPSRHQQESSDELCQLLHAACASKPTHLLVCGDFNLPNIDWENLFS